MLMKVPWSIRGDSVLGFFSERKGSEIANILTFTNEKINLLKITPCIMVTVKSIWPMTQGTMK